MNVSPTSSSRNLYEDVLNDPDRTGRFFWWPHPTQAAFEGCARHLDCAEYDRTRAADILVRQNRLLDAPPPAIEAAESLAKPGAVCAFTGQQAGLFGGPLYTIHKALTLLGWTERLRQMLKRPVVPVFWIASDDHDFEEVRWSAFPNLDNDVQRVAIESDVDSERTPISEIVLGGSVSRAVQELRDSQLKTEFSDKVFEALTHDYAPERKMDEAFGRWMARLLGPFGLVMFNPANEDPKSLMKPLFAEEMRAHLETADALSEINQRLDEAGYHRQVHHADDHTHLFHVSNGRHALKTDGNQSLTIEPEGEFKPASDWIERLETSPNAFSPGVLFRPVAQSYLFPVIASVCGPSEIAYWAQSRALFDRFNTVMPVVLPRSRATIIEGKNRKAVEKLGYDVEDFFGDIEALINNYFERSFPGNLEQMFAEERNDCGERMERLKKAVIDFEPTLEKTFDVTTNKISGAWESLEKKVFQAHKRKGDEVRSKFCKLATHLYPEGKPQERVFGIPFYLNKYGFEFLHRAKEQLKIGTVDHQLIEP
ncbi:MAG: bacillithiol biosynthesis cysteine-adding enzyme BshC [candidate division Zixibacteria bacterium]|nr:bacillithiol biosynthesis cysteine-adding enzyme BshC [candidate division Zixibacteria bacterium]